MDRTVLVTGAGGFVAGNIITQGGKGVTFHGLEKVPADLSGDNLIWHAIDLRDADALGEIFSAIAPDVVIHTAALSDIDYCQAHQEEAEQVNVGITRTLVDLCAGARARMIYFSSDSIFDGRKGKYVEEDPPAPLHFYGKTKVQGEKIVQQGCDDWVIIRPSLIVGLPVLEAGNSFLWRMIKELKLGRTVAFPKQEIRSPLDVITLSRAVLELAGNNYRGILHISGNDTMNRFDMAQRIVGKLGYPTDSVIDKKPVVNSGRAQRPRDVSLNNARAKAVLATPMLDFDQALELIIENKGDKAL
jgi:dTDP-4-dehydrorhamnose reductase